MKKIKLTPEQAAIARAVNLAGGKTALMHKLNERGHIVKSRNTVGQWLKNGAPDKYCPDIEDLTAVRCEDLSPEPNWTFLRNTVTAIKA